MIIVLALALVEPPPPAAQRARPGAGTVPLPAYTQADPFFTGLYIESSRGAGRVLIPALSVLAAERAMPGVGSHAARLRFAETVPFTAAHALDADSWPTTEWTVTHPAAIAWQAAKTGEPVTVLSLTPEAYEGTGVYPLNPS